MTGPAPRVFPDAFYGSEPGGFANVNPLRVDVVPPGPVVLSSDGAGGAYSIRSTLTTRPPTPCSHS